MKSHRLEPDSEQPSGDTVAAYGTEDVSFPNGVNHLQSHPVVRSHPLIETKVGAYIQDVGDAPSVWHGVIPSVSRTQVEDEWERRQHEGTMIAGDTTPTIPEVDPVPVYVVNPNTGAKGLSSWSGSNYSITDVKQVEIANRDYKRTRVFIRNEDTTAANGIRIAKQDGPNAFGFLIPGGTVQEVATQDKIYAIGVTPATTVKVSVLIEYGIDGGS